VDELPWNERFGRQYLDAGEPPAVHPEDLLQLFGHQLVEKLAPEFAQLLGELLDVTLRAQPAVLDALVETAHVFLRVAGDRPRFEAIEKVECRRLQLVLVVEGPSPLSLADAELMQRLRQRGGARRLAIGRPAGRGAGARTRQDDSGGEFERNERDLTLTCHHPDARLTRVGRPKVEIDRLGFSRRGHVDLGTTLANGLDIGLGQDLDDQALARVDLGGRLACCLVDGTPDGLARDDDLDGGDSIDHHPLIHISVDMTSCQRCRSRHGGLRVKRPPSLDQAAVESVGQHRKRRAGRDRGFAIAAAESRAVCIVGFTRRLEIG